jgi:hypothetical protein
MRTNGVSNQDVWLELLGIIIIGKAIELTSNVMLCFIQLGEKLTPLCDLTF